MTTKRIVVLNESFVSVGSFDCDHTHNQGFFFFFPSLQCGHIGCHSQEELAKFDYWSKRKVKKSNNHVILLELIV